MCFPPVHIFKTTIMIVKVAPKNTDDIRKHTLGFCAYGTSFRADEAQVFEG